MSAIEQDDIVEIFTPQTGYDMASSWYDNWHWTEFWRRNELPITAALIDSLPQGRALDAGSGTGVYSAALQARGHETVAIDISRRMLEVQAAKSVGAARLVQGDIQTMPSDWYDSFDTVVCARVLSHVQNYQLALYKLGAILRRGGRMIITDVDSEHPYNYVTVKNGVVYSRIRVFKHSHLQLAAALRSVGLSIISFRRCRLADLRWKPDRCQFPQIHSVPETPIFFVYEVVKR